MQDTLLRVVMYAAFLLAGLALFGALLEWLEERKEAKQEIPETLHDEIAGIIILGVLNEGVTLWQSNLRTLHVRHFGTRRGKRRWKRMPQVEASPSRRMKK